MFVLENNITDTKGIDAQLKLVHDAVFQLLNTVISE